jgi:hypothetical protein
MRNSVPRMPRNKRSAFPFFELTLTLVDSIASSTSCSHICWCPRGSMFVAKQTTAALPGFGRSSFMLFIFFRLRRRFAKARRRFVFASLGRVLYPCNSGRKNEKATSEIFASSIMQSVKELKSKIRLIRHTNSSRRASHKTRRSTQWRN